jgi:hypothetical protein
VTLQQGNRTVRYVNMGDCAECIWLRAEGVSSAGAIYIQGPEWEVAPGIHLTPGKTRWATQDDLPKEWLDRFEWHED